MIKGGKMYLGKFQRIILITVFMLQLICFNSPLFANNEEKSISNSEQFIKNLIEEYTCGLKIVTLPISDGENIAVEIHDFYYDGEYLTMSGFDVENSQSEFIIKATKDEVYGWIHYFAEKFKDGVVYKYSTDDIKIVTVKRVSVSDIISVQESIGGTKRTGKPKKVTKLRQNGLPDLPIFQPIPADINLNQLQSKPESEKILWMDLREHMDGDELKSSAENYTREDVWVMWQSIAMGFAVYDVNVTTSIDVFNATPAQNRGIGKYRNVHAGLLSRCAYDAFGTMSDCEFYPESDGYEAGMTGVHEYSHLLGVNDQGCASNGYVQQTYFKGYDGVKWVPIMGYVHSANKWDEDALLQWTKGDYKAPWGWDAHPQEEVLTKMARYITPEEDDIPLSKPLNINSNGEVVLEENYGLINVVIDGYDEDDFTFEVTGESNDIDLKIDRIGHLKVAMLDVQAYLLNNQGEVLVEDNPIAARYANIQTTVGPGVYTLRIEGGAETISSEDFFSRYGSIGYYGISGTIGNHSVANNKKFQQKSLGNIINKDGVIKFSGLSNGKNVNVSIYNISGRKVFKKELAGKGKLDVRNIISPGYYFVHLNSRDSFIKKKILISR